MISGYAVPAAAGLSFRRCSDLIAGLGRFAIAAALALLAGCANQAPILGVQHTFPVATLPGAPTKVGFFTALNPDCTFVDYATIRTLVSPSHGALTEKRGSDFPNYAANNQRFDCNKNKVPGTFVHYQSDLGYAGTDTVKIEVIFPDGGLHTDTYHLRVGATAEEQGAKDVSVARASLSGSIQKLDFQYSIDPDCTSAGETKVRVTRAPSHGTLKIEEGEDYTAFPKNNPRYDCNKQKLRGSLVYYQSEAGYTGPDSAKVEVTYPQGTIKSILYNLTVK